MAGISIGRVWDEAWAFLRAESALLVPVALATIGAAMLLLTQVIPDPVNNRLPQGAWLLWLLPVYALMLTGVIAMSALVLRPGLSVAESFRLVVRRLPIAAAVAVLLVGLSMAASVPVAVASLIDVQRSGAPGGLTALANGAMLAVTVWLWIRLLPLWAIVAEGRATPMAVFRDCFALTRGVAAPLLGLTMAAFAGAMVVGAALLFAGGAALMIVGRAIGGVELGSLLVSILLAGLTAVATMIWTVLIAVLYRQLANSRAG
jgi:hypothetical protein